MKTRKSWREKMETAREAKIVKIPPRMHAKYGKGTMLIPSMLDLDALIRKVPRGRLITYGQIREELARAAGTDCTCPMVTGMFVRIVAEAAAEDAAGGRSRITPYWRVLRDDGSLLEKIPGGPSAQAERLESEGHKVERSGKARVQLPSAR